jgi:hypothetical protein
MRGMRPRTGADFGYVHVERFAIEIGVEQVFVDSFNGVV